MPKQQVFEVERILERRVRRRKTEYLIKWQGYPQSEASWEQQKNLENIAGIIREFEVKLEGVVKKEEAVNQTQQPALHQGKQAHKPLIPFSKGNTQIIALDETFCGEMANSFAQPPYGSFPASPSFFPSSTETESFNPCKIGLNIDSKPSRIDLISKDNISIETINVNTRFNIKEQSGKDNKKTVKENKRAVKESKRAIKERKKNEKQMKTQAQMKQSRAADTSKSISNSKNKDRMSSNSKNKDKIQSCSKDKPAVSKQSKSMSPKSCKIKSARIDPAKSKPAQMPQTIEKKASLRIEKNASVRIDKQASLMMEKKASIIVLNSSSQAQEMHTLCQKDQRQVEVNEMEMSFNQSFEGKEVKKIQLIRVVQAIDSELPDYLVSYEDKSIRVFSTLELVTLHPYEFICFLQKKAHLNK